MKFFLLSIAVLFAASLVGYFWVRSFREEDWIPPGWNFRLEGLWVSTLVLLASSWTFRAVFRSHPDLRKPYLGLTFGLGCLFLVLQIWNWIDLANRGITPLTPSLFSFTFYFLTSLHALHVIGGLIPLGIFFFRGDKQVKSEQESLEITAMYWHFLDAVWIILFILLYYT
jgi:cytochrome c oxidase subunit 3